MATSANTRHFQTIFSIFIAVCAIGGTGKNAIAALPADLQKLLNQLPEKKLSLELILGRAVQTSDSFKAIQAQHLSKEVPLLQARTPLETRVTANASVVRDRRKALSPVSPDLIETNSAALGIRSYFATGTDLSFEFSHNKTELDFPAFPVPSSFETRGTLTLSQNLWQDALGKGTRAAMDAGRLMAEANELAIRESVDEFVLGLVQLYYGAWLSQAQLEAAQESVASRSRLLEITRLKARRGTAEEQDLLQVRSALLNTRIQADEAAHTLGNRWRDLVVSLKLPEKWLSADPSKIPVALDAPIEETLELCGPPGAPKPAPDSNSSSRRALLAAQAAGFMLQSSTDAAKPDLELRATVSSNGVRETIGPTFTETFRFQNPAWNIGLQLTLPLDSYAQKAAALSALTSEIQAESQSTLARDNLVTNWLSGCANLNRAEKSYQARLEAHRAQRKRASIEESHFRIGRSGILQVIQAADDATLAQMNLAVSEVDRRTAAWRIRQLADRVHPFLLKLKDIQWDEGGL